MKITRVLKFFLCFYGALDRFPFTLSSEQDSRRVLKSNGVFLFSYCKQKGTFDPQENSVYILLEGSIFDKLFTGRYRTLFQTKV